MRTILVPCILVILIFPRLTFAVEADAAAPAVAQPPAAQNVQPAANDLKILQARVDQLSNALILLEHEKAALSERVAQLTQAIGNARAGADGTLEDRVARMSDQLKSATKQDGEVVIPNVRAAMDKSATFRSDLFAVTNAKILIQNYAGRRVALYINGALWSLRPGKTEINVPYGPVRVEFAYFHRDKHWTYTEKDWKHDEHGAQLTIEINSGASRPGEI